MSVSRTIARAVATVGALALVAGPLASGAQAAPKKKTPTPVITQRPANPTNQQTATFAFTDALATAKYLCSVDFAAWAPCTSPITYAGPFAARAHNFRLRANAPGRSPSSVVTANWTVDLTPPPVPALSGVPGALTSTSDATLSFTDTQAGVTFFCSLDGEDPAECTSPVVLTGLDETTHTFSVYAAEASGNVSDPATGEWTIDHTAPPVPTIVSGPAALTPLTSATFRVADADVNATLTCSLDGAAYAACGPTVSYSSLSATAHTFDLRATDAANNHSDAPQFTWTINASALTPASIDSGPDAYTNNPVGSFTLTLPGDAVQLRCSLDTAAFADCSSSYSTPSLADGPHTLLVEARNAASLDSAPVAWNWTVDTVKPPKPTVHGPASPTKATSASFTMGDNENGVALSCALDSGAFTACGPTLSIAGPLANGSHTLHVKATDAATNSNTTDYTWTVDLVAPTAALTLPATITGAVGAMFSEPVKGITATSLVLRVTNSTTNLPASIACKTAAGAAVSCATGPVKSAALKPSKALIPGQHYTTVANPAGSRSITDIAGNRLTPKAVAFRAQTIVQESGAATTYAWRSVAQPLAYGGAYRTEHRAGASVSYPFTGTSVTWYTAKGASQGIANVYIDGVKKATVNNYAATATFKVARAVTGLTNAKHTLKIVAAGVKGSAKGTGTSVIVDAVKVGAGAVVANPTLLNRWQVVAAPAASGGMLAAADLPTESASMTFRGVSISFRTSTGRNRGIAKLYVDGVLKGTYDLYAASTTYNVAKTVTGLTNAVHTVKVVVTGTHRAGATGALVTLDRWVIG